MNVLFLSLGEFDDLSNGSVHIDLIKEFSKYHTVYVVCKRERRQGKPTELSIEYGINILRVKTGNIKNVNLIEKGVSTILVEYQYKNAIKKFFSDVKFDLVIYTTPPITLVSTINYVKKRDDAKSYLMLKDIFPQNAVDLEMMTTIGLKGLIYKYFRCKEKRLYTISDRIGCMSQANVDYVLSHNSSISKNKVEICPNCIDVKNMTISENERVEIRNKYGIPLDKKVFVYGGNLGKPQGVPFIIECLKAEKDNQDVFFLIVGKGTEYSKLEKYYNEEHPTNFKLMQQLPKDDYDRMIAACDVGMIFLDHRFTIPNFPSRLLSYMQAGLPVLACTDSNTDVGKVIAENGFGWCCESNDVNYFKKLCGDILNLELGKERKKAIEYLNNNYSVDIAYKVIVKNEDE